MQHIQWGKKVFEPLPILQVLPLAKKCVIYNCNGRCILKVRNRISTNKSRKLRFITFMTLFVFDAENKYLNIYVCVCVCLRCFLQAQSSEWHCWYVGVSEN